MMPYYIIENVEGKDVGSAIFVQGEKEGETQVTIAYDFLFRVEAREELIRDLDMIAKKYAL